MGTFQSPFKNPLSTKLSDQVHKAPVSAKAQAVASEPVAKLEVALKPRKAAAVSNAKPDAKPVSNGAARIARWRAKQDPEVRKQQNREAVQRSRAERKAGGS